MVFGIYTIWLLEYLVSIKISILSFQNKDGYSFDYILVVWDQISASNTGILW